MTEKATRRKFSAEYKLRILAEAEASTERGQIGALLRRAMHPTLHEMEISPWKQFRSTFVDHLAILVYGFHVCLTLSWYAARSSSVLAGITSKETGDDADNRGL